MCGRYLLSYDLKSLIELLKNRWNIKTPYIDYYEPDYNIAPGQTVLAIYQNKDSEYLLSEFQWGYLPNWSKDLSKKMINARSESIDKKPYFRDSFHKRKCLILASGFYEWQRDKIKTPYYVGIKDNNLFSFAGIWDFHPLQPDVKTCAILTTRANSLVSPIHDRMPVMLEHDSEKDWLAIGKTDFINLFEPFNADRMRVYEVSNYVNNWRNNSKQCIEPFSNEQLKF
ncbi:MAG: SOS response-associated peptidase [Eubacteriales bacterium]|nr:SOS response-associated peptidase [Eubacteriales bacterium]